MERNAAARNRGGKPRAAEKTKGGGEKEGKRGRTISKGNSFLFLSHSCSLSLSLSRFPSRERPSHRSSEPATHTRVSQLDKWGRRGEGGGSECCCCCCALVLFSLFFLLLRSKSEESDFFWFGALSLSSRRAVGDAALRGSRSSGGPGRSGTGSGGGRHARRGPLALGGLGGRGRSGRRSGRGLLLGGGGGRGSAPGGGGGLRGALSLVVVSVLEARQGEGERSKERRDTEIEQVKRGDPVFFGSFGKNHARQRRKKERREIL